VINPVSSATQTQPAAQSTPASQKPSPSKPQSTTVTDTVQLSPAAQALQEATETVAQTTKEANSGDLQARRLLSQEAAAAKASKK
jgi:hypothetical protein